MLRRITKLELENFQSHRRTTLETDGNVVALVGETDQGKTAVLRGLYWVLTNRPSGIGFASNWIKQTNSKGAVTLRQGEKCEVSVTFEDTDGNVHKVSRRRSATENCYIVDGVTLDAVGTDVPESVAQLFCMRDVNMQRQTDGHFLLTLPPGQVAGRLNELVNLDSIDTAYGYMHRRKIEAGYRYKEAQLSVTKAKVQLDALKHIPQVTADVEVLDVLLHDREVLQDRLDGIDRLLGGMRAGKAALASLPDSRTETQVSVVQGLLEDIAELQGSVQRMRTLCAGYADARDGLSGLPSCTEEQLASLHDSVSEIAGTRNRLQKICEATDAFGDVLRLLQENDRELEELTSMLPETCPLCGAPIGDCLHG